MEQSSNSGTLVLSQDDKRALQEAGITDLDQLAKAAVTFLRIYPQRQPQLIELSDALSSEETAFLREGGAYGICNEQSNFNTNLLAVVAEYALMAATALSQRETANILGISLRSVHQRVSNRMLYSVEGQNGKVFPKFQFFDNKMVPGITRVLIKISDEAHPVSIQRFFLTPTVDLESIQFNCPMSPREWLITGHSSNPVAILAADL